MPRHPAPQRPIVPLLCLLAAAWSAHAGAQDAGAAGSPAPSPAAAWPPAQASAGLDDVVVSATRSVQRSFDAPAAIQAVGQEAIGEAGPRVELSESLSRIPGIVALSRQNWAQDTPRSIRGFGARASFGIRGGRLLVDGIPATMPDGQGQVSHFDLAGAQRIEVLEVRYPKPAQ